MFDIPISNDIVLEPEETFSLTIDPPAQVTVGSPGSAAVIIMDDDRKLCNALCNYVSPPPCNCVYLLIFLAILVVLEYGLHKDTRLTIYEAKENCITERVNAK